MNRREAVALLVSMPGITRISRAPVQPKDVIVVEADCMLSQAQTEHIKAYLGDIWPDNKVIILADGLKLKVVSQ